MGANWSRLVAAQSLYIHPFPPPISLLLKRPYTHTHTHVFAGNIATPLAVAYASVNLRLCMHVCVTFIR